MKKINDIDYERIATKVSCISIIINTFLSVFKLFAGIIGKSGSMLSDSIHSMSDVFSSIIVIIGVKLANKKADKEHQYGHERFECVVAIILSVSLIFIGGSIGISGIKNIISGNYKYLDIPSSFTLFVAIISVITKEGMFWYTKIAANKINSTSLMADAWHHRSDSLSSIGCFLGILASRLGFQIFDSIASIIICAFILKAGYEIFIDAVKKMIDQSCDDEIVLKIENIASSQDGVENVDMIRTRLFGNKIYIDLEISIDGNKNLKDADEIAQNVHNKIEEDMNFVKHCMIHINPA